MIIAMTGPLILVCVGAICVILIPAIIADAYRCTSLYIPELYRSLPMPIFVVVILSMSIGVLVTAVSVCQTACIILEAVAAW